MPEYAPFDEEIADRRLLLADPDGQDELADLVLDPAFPLVVAVLEGVRATAENIVEAALVARCALARELGINCAEEGTIVTDSHQATSVRGVYACGDIVHEALNQIAVAGGQAAMAATAIHNGLQQRPSATR